MIGGIEMKLSLQANKPAFYFITSAAEYTVEVSWTQVALKLLGVKVAPPVLTILEKKLTSKPAIYPITRTDVVEKVVPIGGSNVPIDNLQSAPKVSDHLLWRAMHIQCVCRLSPLLIGFSR